MLVGILLSGLLWHACDARAATTNRWTNSISGLWRVGTNWSAAQPPSASFDHIAITNAGTKTVTLDAATPAGNLSVNSLRIGAPTGSTNTLVIADVPAGTPFTTARPLLVDRNGILLVTNSTLSVQDTFDVLGGSVVLESGLIDTTVNNVNIRIGRSSGATGTFTLNGGTVDCFGLNLGSLADSQGFFTLNAGTLHSSSVVSIGDILNTTGTVSIVSGSFIATNDITKIGNLGRGQWTQNGGSSAFAFLSVGDNMPGTLTLSGGQLTVTPAAETDITRVGNFGSAQFNISSGTVALKGEFHVADNPGVDGTVLMTGGQLFSTNALVAIGRYGIGTFTITNATAYFTNTSVGRHADAIGTLNVASGGSVYCVDDLSIGRFTNAVGHVVVSGGLLSPGTDHIWVGREGIGDLTVSGGTVRAGGMYVGMSPDTTNSPQGTVTLSGGNTLLSSNLVIGTSLLSTGQLSVLGGTLVVTNPAGSAWLNVASGTLELNQGIITTDTLRLTNSTGQFVFSGGTLESKNSTISNGQPFVVGDGISSATFRLFGGTHSFANGLVITNNGTLTGCGTIIGSVINYGTIATNCGSGGQAPAITQSPTNQTVFQGSNATFTVTAGGTPPLNFQWRFNSNALSGSTSTNLLLANVQKTNAGAYDVVVTNSFGSTTSSVAILTVLLAPSITSQPASLGVLEGDSATFSVTADGTPPLRYQWRFNSNSLAGATKSSMTLTNVQSTNTGSYQVVVTNAYGSATSAVATLRLLVGPRITSITKTGTTVTVFFTTTNGPNYILEYSSNLTSMNWTAILPGVVGSGGLTNKQDVTATNRARFYRIHVQ